MDMDIDSLELTVRSQNALRSAGINTVEELAQLSWDKLDEIANLGEKSTAEVCWKCVQVLNGKMAIAMEDWNKRWPPTPRQPDPPENWRELKRKAKAFDSIAEIIKRKG